MLLVNEVDGIIAEMHNLGIKEYQQLGLSITTFDRKLSDKILIVSSDDYQRIKLTVRDLPQVGW